MTKPTTITLAAMRGKVRRIHPRVLIANTLLFQVASVLVAALWSAIVCGFNGWGVLPGLLMGAGAAGAGFLVVDGLVGLDVAIGTVGGAADDAGMGCIADPRFAGGRAGGNSFLGSDCGGGGGLGAYAGASQNGQVRGGNEGDLLGDAESLSPCFARDSRTSSAAGRQHPIAGVSRLDAFAGSRRIYC